PIWRASSTPIPKAACGAPIGSLSGVSRPSSRKSRSAGSGSRSVARESWIASGTRSKRESRSKSPNGQLEAGDRVDYVIRVCESLSELGACVELQQRIWGYAEPEVYPPRLFVTLTKIGGHVLGAFTAQGK